MRMWRASSARECVMACHTSSAWLSVWPVVMAVTCSGWCLASQGQSHVTNKLREERAVEHPAERASGGLPV